MHRTIEAILHPDGTVEALEALQSPTSRRALLTILDEAPVSAAAPRADDEHAQVEAILRAAGVVDEADDIPDDLQPLAEAELDAIWARIPAGTPLSRIIIEERDEAF